MKWKDVDWLAKTIRIERGVVKQIVDDVKSSYSAGSMLIADVLLESVKQWKQMTQFPGAEDWRHSDIRTTMNIYGDAVTDDIRRASREVARIALAVT